MAKSASSTKDVTTEPVVTIADIHLLVGPLEFNGYPTLRGRVIRQPTKDAVFSAYAFKADDEDKAVSSIADLEHSCSPYKEGIDASLVTVTRPDFAGKKPRPDLLFDMLYQSDMDEELVRELAKSVRDSAIDEQIVTLAKRAIGSKSGGSKGIGKRVAAGLHRLEEMDSSWDEVFITRAVSFIVQYTDRTFSDYDVQNLGFLSAVLNGTTEEVSDAPTSFSL